MYICMNICLFGLERSIINLYGEEYYILVADGTKRPFDDDESWIMLEENE